MQASSPFHSHKASTNTQPDDSEPKQSFGSSSVKPPVVSTKKSDGNAWPVAEGSVNDANVRTGDQMTATSSSSVSIQHQSPHPFALGSMLATWGMDFPAHPSQQDLNNALLFICQLDPTTPDYQHTASAASKLINEGADVRATTKSGLTALILATHATQKNTEVKAVHEQENLHLIKQLIQLGSPLNHQDSKGRTALMLAIMFDLPEVVHSLCSAGADISIQDNKQRNAWWYAIEKTDYPEKICDYLGSFSVETSSINVKNKKGQTPLMVSIEGLSNKGPHTNQSARLVQILLRHGADPKPADNQGNNAWHYVAKSPNLNLFTALGHYDNTGTAINEENKQGKTAFSIAIRPQYWDDNDDSSFYPSISDDGNSFSVNTFEIMADLLRFGATPPREDMVVDYALLREFEAALPRMFNQIKNRFIDRYKDELSELETACRQPGSVQTYQAYGGDAGHAYFEFFGSQIAEPVLGEFFRSARQIMKNSSLAWKLIKPVFLDIVLTQTGEMRNHVYKITNPNDIGRIHRYGKRLFFDTNLFDFVNEYSSWNRHVLKAIRTTMLGEFNIMNKKMKPVSAKDLLDEMLTKDTGPFGEQLYPTLSWPLSKDYFFRKLVSASTYIFKKKNTVDFLLTFPSEFLEKTHLKAEDIETLGNVTIRCHHYSSRLDSRMASEATDALIDAVLLPADSKLQENLTEHLFDLMKYLYQASHFSNGQATVTEWLAGGLCKSHGLQFAYPELRTNGSRNNLSLDHQFLSDFDGSLYRRFKEKVSFTAPDRQ